MVIDTASSSYGSYQVVDAFFYGKPARTLETVPDGVVLSAVVRGERGGNSLVGYLQRLHEVFVATQPSSLLMVGGGAGCLVTAIADDNTSSHIDVVEIDVTVAELGKKHFRLEENEKLRITIGDGATYIATTNGIYDLVIADVFFATDIPEHMLTSDVARNYRRIMSGDGILAMNVLIHYGKNQINPAWLIDILQGVFQTVIYFPVTPELREDAPQNIVVIATDRNIDDIPRLWTALRR